MSRVGKMPIKLVSGVEAKITGQTIVVKGPKGELSLELKGDIKINLENGEIIVSCEKTDKRNRSLWGLYRNLINNMVVGVSTGFSKKLEINGVGFKIALSGNDLLLNLGLSHQVVFPLPKEIKAIIEGNSVTFTGADKYLVGETAAKLRRLKKPEPYKGKGIKYAGEFIRRKEGKTAASK